MTAPPALPGDSSGAAYPLDSLNVRFKECQPLDKNSLEANRFAG
jgi:hypothetical protein